MTKDVSVREDLLYGINQIMGEEPYTVVCSNELRYEVNVRTTDGSYVALFLDKDLIGKGGRVTFEVSCFRKEIHGNALILCKRFYNYEEAALFLIKYRPILCDFVRSFVGYQESILLLSRV